VGELPIAVYVPVLPAMQRRVIRVDPLSEEQTPGLAAVAIAPGQEGKPSLNRVGVVSVDALMDPACAVLGGHPSETPGNRITKRDCVSQSGEFRRGSLQALGLGTTANPVPKPSLIVPNPLASKGPRQTTRGTANPF
jgi:hypothetical protein